MIGKAGILGEMLSVKKLCYLSSFRYNLGAFYFGTNHFARAKYQFNESYKIHKIFLGDDHLDCNVIKQALDEVSKMTGM